MADVISNGESGKSARDDINAAFEQLFGVSERVFSNRGGYDASVNLFPSTGGRGTAGDILLGDRYTITVPGTLGGTAVIAGQEIWALVNTPGQTAGNWFISLAGGGSFDLANAIHSATAETEILDADEVGFWKSVSGVLRKITWANIKATLKAYFDTLYTLFVPSTQPVISTGTMTLNCTNREEAMFEGRTSTGTLTITDDFTIALSNTAGTKLISLILTLTGTNVITFPNTVMCSNPSTKGVWLNNVLTMSSGTGAIVEFQFIWYASASKWQLKVGEEGIV